MEMESLMSHLSLLGQARVPAPTTIGTRRPTVSIVKRDTPVRVVGISAQMEVLLMSR